MASRLKGITISGLEYKNHTLFMTKMAKVSENRYPIYEKTIPFGASHTYKAHIREYPPGVLLSDNMFISLVCDCLF